MSETPPMKDRTFRCAAAAIIVVALARPSWATPGEFVQGSRRNPRYRETADGLPFIPNGLHLAHPLHGGPGHERENRTAWVNALANQCGHRIRVWRGHSWWCPETALGVFDESAAHRRRDLLDLCGRRGVRGRTPFTRLRRSPRIGRSDWPWEAP